MGRRVQHRSPGPVTRRRHPGGTVLCSLGRPLADRPVELGALRSQRRGEAWVSRHVSANGVICVSWQQICVGASHAGANVDVHVGEQLLQIWRGQELIKTVTRTSRGEVRKKNASVQTART